MRIAFVCEFDINDPNRRSGVPFFIAKGFRDLGHEVIQIGPFHNNRSFYNRGKNFIRTLWYNKILKGKKGEINNFWSKEFLSNFALQAKKQLENLEYDIIFSPESHTIAYLDIDKPIVFWRDATFGNMLDLYHFFFNLHPSCIREGHLADKLAIQKSLVVVYTSTWAKNYAKEHYSANDEQLIILERGANLLNEPPFDFISSSINSKKATIQLKLLFIAANWERKGGDIAFAVVQHLKDAGIDAVLEIAGAQPPQNVTNTSWVNYHGFIKKNTIEGIKLLEDLYNTSHFFIMPSIAENFGIVYAEASAYGVPNIAYNTGGVSSAVKNNENGILFYLNETPQNIAKNISTIWANKDEYVKLAFSTRKMYETNLNWKVNCEKLIQKIQARIDVKK